MKHRKSSFITWDQWVNYFNSFCMISMLQIYRNYGYQFHFFANSFDSQSNPSYKPFPWVAQVAWMYHWNEIKTVLVYQWFCLYQLSTAKQCLSQLRTVVCGMINFSIQWFWISYSIKKSVETFEKLRVCLRLKLPTLT